MCGLFGFVDYGRSLTRKQRSQLLTELSIASEVRGTDATGIAYNQVGTLYIRKRPLPARKMWFRVSAESAIVLGHTRMASQGSAKHSFNAHPFPGFAGQSFALAHNGHIQNDRSLRRKEQLPPTHIETDSYVAVQLLERWGTLSFETLRKTAEILEGSFTFTLLSGDDALWLIRGNNPLYLVHFPGTGLYVYASTEDILKKALRQLPFSLGRRETVPLSSGDLLRIDSRGKLSRRYFNDSHLYHSFGCFWDSWPRYLTGMNDPNSGHIADLKAVAPYFGFSPSDIDKMLKQGMSLSEIEEFLYCT